MVGRYRIVMMLINLECVIMIISSFLVTISPIKNSFKIGIIDML